MPLAKRSGSTAIAFMDSSSAEFFDRLRQAIHETNLSKESTRVLGSHHNALAPISRLPPEILAEIFCFFTSSTWNKEYGHLAWIRVTHVCHQWRETALSHPRLWSHINFTKLMPTAMAEVLARAKMAPLHLEADFSKSRMSMAQLDAFVRKSDLFDILEAHISHTRHLSIRGQLQTAVERLISSAPTLESLSLSHKYLIFSTPHVIIPINLFNSITPASQPSSSRTVTLVGSRLSSGVYKPSR